MAELKRRKMKIVAKKQDIGAQISAIPAPYPPPRRAKDEKNPPKPENVEIQEPDSETPIDYGTRISAILADCISTAPRFEAVSQVTEPDPEPVPVPEPPGSPVIIRHKDGRPIMEVLYERVKDDSWIKIKSELGILEDVDIVRASMEQRASRLKDNIRQAKQFGDKIEKVKEKLDRCKKSLDECWEELEGTRKLLSECCGNKL